MVNPTRRTGEPNEAPRLAAAVMIRDVTMPDLNKVNGLLQGGARGAPAWRWRARILARLGLFDPNGQTSLRGPVAPNFEGLPILAHQ